jgi:hypothetical protein
VLPDRGGAITVGQPVAFFEVLSSDHERFAMFTDPDGNPVGLWA